MRKLTLFALSFLFIEGVIIERSWAYVPSARMILSRVGEKAVKKSLVVEQEVQLGAGSEMVSLKENWFFENENNYRLVVEGEKDLKGQLLFQNTYTEREKTSTISGQLETQRLARPLLEKIHFLKGADPLFRFLQQLGVLNEEASRSEIFKRAPVATGFQYLPEAFTRLGRMGGVVAYILGPNPSGEGMAAGLWVEQDQFEVLKLRIPSGEELRFEKQASFSKGVKWPKESIYSWNSSRGNQAAVTQVLSVDLIEGGQRVPLNKGIDKRTSAFENHKSAKLVEEFYQRFR